MVRKPLPLLVPLTALVAAAVAAPAADAVTTRTWRVTTYRDFDEGETQGVLLTSLGDAASGFTATRVDVAESQVFSSAAAPDGSVWLGTGDQAQLYRLEPGKPARKVARLEGVLVSALVVAPDGTLYAGTLPGGRVFRLDRGSDKPRELARLEGAEHIWALVLDGKTLYAATGPSGRVYAVDAQSGKNRVFWDSGEKHILSLAADGKGGLVAGSAEEAILYRIGPDGAARALHDFDGDEVRAIARHGEAMFVLVNEFQKNASSASSSASKPHGTRIVVPPGAPMAASGAAKERKGKGAVYRVEADGRVEQLHALGDSYFTALHVDAGGSVFAAAGGNGRLYLVRPDRTVLTAFDLPERQILTLALGGSQPVLGTGDAGALYRVDFAPPKDARYLSKVFDAGFPGRWGAVRWSATGEIGVETRSGNTARPDKTWSAWQAPSRPGKGHETEGKVVSPPGRYLQFRASFGKGATLRDVTVHYLPQNQRPRVTEIVVGDDPGQKLARAARAAGKPRSPIVKIKWKSENPDDDELVYRLWYREETEANWKPLGGPEPLTKGEHEWNTETIPDGNYVLRVVVSDERANPKGEALEHSLVSTPFLVDNRKPELGGVAVAWPQVTGVAKDSFSPITELAYSLDGGDWQPFAPRDAIFDDPTEEFSVRLPQTLTAGTHSIAVRAVDAADNVGATQVTFRVK